MRARTAGLFCLVCSLGCRPEEEAPRTLITGPRVLAIRAEPPEVAPGESAIVTALIVGSPEPAVVSWSRCSLPPLPGQTSNPDCVTEAGGAFLEPIAVGSEITATMPADATPEALGQPDASGGVYLTLVARVSAGGEMFSAVYRLRLALTNERNRNPIQEGVFALEGDGAVPLDEATPHPVGPGERLGLGVALAQESLESYFAPRGGEDGGVVTEVLRTSWFSTAGELSRDYTNAAQPTTELILERFLPPVGSMIDLYAVTRDERGGAVFSHRTLRLE